jgi:hypothetical protein
MKHYARSYFQTFIKKGEIMNILNTPIAKIDLIGENYVLKIRMNNGQYISVTGRLLEGYGPKYLHAIENSIFYKKTAEF